MPCKRVLCFHFVELNSTAQQECQTHDEYPNDSALSEGALQRSVFQLFIDHLSATFSEDLNLIVLDKGRFHHSKELELPENVVLLFLPPYCPELNLIERLWQDIKVKLFTQPYRTLAEMQRRLTEILRNYSDEAIAKLTRFSYFLKTDNEI